MALMCPPTAGRAAAAQLRIDVEVFSLTTDQLPEQTQLALKRLQRETALAGAEAEKAAEQLRRLEGQQIQGTGRFSRETEDGVPIVVRVGRRRRRPAPSFGLTLTPTLVNGTIEVEAELRTGKPRTGACEPLVRNFHVKVPVGSYAAFWLIAEEADQRDSVVIARFHPSE
jgi:hypothetical protein